MILVAIGANLPGRFPTPLAAAEAAAIDVANLAMLRGPHLLSSWYVTTPVPLSGQPDYINGVIAFSGDGRALPPSFPVDLLAALQAIEARFGRVRTVRDAARVLDLDILAIDDLVRISPDPVLPHPRLHQRRFVLEPLRDVHPGFVHPVRALGIEAMLAALPAGGIARLAGRS